MHCEDGLFCTIYFNRGKEVDDGVSVPWPIINSQDLRSNRMQCAGTMTLAPDSVENTLDQVVRNFTGSPNPISLVTDAPKLCHAEMDVGDAVLIHGYGCYVLEEIGGGRQHWNQIPFVEGGTVDVFANVDATWLENEVAEFEDDDDGDSQD